jgi:hypothetical protein
VLDGEDRHHQGPVGFDTLRSVQRSFCLPLRHLRHVDLAQLLVSHLSQRREHHDDETDSDGDIGRPSLKAIDEGSRPGDEVADAHANSHREEYPERKEAV